MGVTTEPPWLNASGGVAARNGSSSHVINFTTDGSAPFTPTNGTFLVFVIFGGVTHTDPSGTWNERLQPVSSGELSVFTKVTSGDTSITINHNGSNYPTPWKVYQFPAGTTYDTGVGANQVGGTGNEMPTLTGLTGGAGNERLIIAALGRAVNNSGPTTASAVWSGGGIVEDGDSFAAFSGTDGGYLTTAHAINVTATSYLPVITTSYTGGGANDRQTVVFALNAVAPGAGTTPFTKDVTLRWSVRNAFTKDVTLVWSVRNVFTKDHTLRWSVLNAWVKDTALRWSVLNAWTKDVVLRWQVIASWTKDVVLRWTVQGETPPPVVSSGYLTAQRAATAAFIADDPTTAELTPVTRVKTASGGYLNEDEVPRVAQTFKMSLLAYDQRPTTTFAGVERVIDYHLIGPWDMQIAVGDWWTDAEGTTYDVVGFSEGWDYMTKAFVSRRVPRGARP